MVRISVIFSSLRPEKIESVLDTIEKYQNFVEAVVVSPFDIRRRDFVKHVPINGDFKSTDFHDREHKGEMSLSQKYNLALLHASGEYIVFNNDDLHFEEGWANNLLEHMEAEKDSSPYLACFTNSYRGMISNNYTIFGLLYAHQGCISKVDLAKIGGYIYDDRLRTEYVDPDLSLRVWSMGGQVKIFDGVNILTDHYTKRQAIKESKDIVCSSYKHYWARVDSSVFFDIWAPIYFKKCISHIKEIDSFVEQGVIRRIYRGFLEKIYFYFLYFSLFVVQDNSKFSDKIKMKINRGLNRKLKSNLNTFSYSLNQPERKRG